LFGDVAHGNNPASPQNYAFYLWGSVRKPEDAARRYQFRDVKSRNSKTALAQSEKDE
jgi:hypothetical protein